MVGLMERGTNGMYDKIYNRYDQCDVEPMGHRTCGLQTNGLSDQ